MKKSLFSEFSSEYKSKSLKKTFFLMAFLRVFILCFLFISSNSFSQETIVLGLDNIHASGGAIIVQKNNETNNIESIGSSTSNSQISTEKLAENNYSEERKPSIIEKKSYEAEQEKKLVKKIEKKLIKKIKDNKKYIFVYNGNKKAEFNFTSSINGSNFFINSHHDYSIGKYIKTEYYFDAFLFAYKKSIHVLYKFHQSKFVEFFFFTRPPPCLFI